MRLLLWKGLWPTFLLAAAATGLMHSRQPDDPAIAEFAPLVRQLGAGKFADREAASERFAAIGEPALPALQHAATTSGDAEIRSRARHAMRAIVLANRRSRSTGMEMALIDPGEFFMGSPRNESGRRLDEPRHRVRITRPFLLGIYEVTQGEYRRVMELNPSSFAPGAAHGAEIDGVDADRLPVDSLSWFDAVAFCNRLSERDGYPPYYELSDVRRTADSSIESASVRTVGGHGYRLPTEAEWEYACRAGTDTRFHFGDRNSGREANLKSGPAGGYGAPPSWDPLERTAEVGCYPPNPWGLRDMHGNVAEWCGDWYDREYYGVSPVDDPPGPDEGRHRVVRGGAWLVPETSCRSASRYFTTPDTRYNYVGFRVGRTP